MNVCQRAQQCGKIYLGVIVLAIGVVRSFIDVYLESRRTKWYGNNYEQNYRDR